MIPFFVADRPMSLRILADSFARAPRITVGLLAHAHVSAEFARLFARFPAGSADMRHELPVDVVRMGDSAIFGGALSYDELFERYDTLNVRYGIMRDVFGDAHATVVSAREAVKVYGQKRRKFKLVLVAQGQSIDQYVECYRRLVRLGPYPIAIGGLLRKRLASVRYLYVGSETQMYGVVRALRDRFAPSWLFLLGAYHPSRHASLERLSVYGADYKGWIFQYAHRQDGLISSANDLLSSGRLRGAARAAATAFRDSAVNEREARSYYARTKNTDPHSRADKRLLRDAWREAAERSHFCAQQLLEALECRTLQNDDAATVLRRLLSQSERSVRFEGVHDYLARHVYPQCVNNELGAVESR